MAFSWLMVFAALVPPRPDQPGQATIGLDSLVTTSYRMRQWLGKSVPDRATYGQSGGVLLGSSMSLKGTFRLWNILMAIADLSPKTKPNRDDLPPGTNLCDYCVAKCCRYFALPIDIPDSWRDFEFIRWYLLHEQASVFVDEGDWYLMVHTVCKFLQDDHRCGIYHTRPDICREYSTENCEYEDDWTYDQYFETPEQVYEYAEAILPPRKGGSFRTTKPSLLPIL